MDALSSAPHYRAHLLPLWEALPESLRGNRIDLDGGGPQYRPLRSLPQPSGDRVLVASFRDMGHAWHRGYRRIAFLEHGAGQSYQGLEHGSYVGGPGREHVSLFLSPNESAATIERERYPKARVEVIGDPVLDTLPRRAPDGPPVVALSFHWDWMRLPELRTALPHHLSALPDLTRRFQIIGHAHPRAMDRLQPIYRRLGIEIVPSFEEVCRRASVYVCDNSSTLFEFASTGRPVVVLNAPWYRRDIEHGLRFWAAAGIGRNVDQPEDLAEAVACAVAEAFIERGQHPELAGCPPASVTEALRIAYCSLTGAAAGGAAVLADWAA